MILFDQDTENVIARNVEVADSFWTRFRGLMFRRKFREGDAMLFEFSETKKFSIHTFFVFFSIDLIYLDDDFTVLEIEKNLPPFRFYTPDKEAKYLIELPAGVIEKKEIMEGHELQILHHKA